MIKLAPIAVLLPCFNSELTIARSLDSLLGQDLTDFCCIVIDNGSSDYTLDIVKQKTEGDPRFEVFKNNQNRGVADSFQRLIQLSKSDFTIFLAADDWLHPSCLRLLLETLVEDSRAVCAAPVTQRFRDDGFKMLSDGTSAIRANKALKRMNKYLSCLTDNSRFYGLYRTDALKESNIPLDFFAADLVLTCLTCRFGDHVEVSSKEGAPLLFRELPKSMRKYIPANPSVFLILRLFVAPFASGIRTLYQHLPKSHTFLLFPRLVWLNVLLAFAVVRSFLASSSLLRKIYFSWSR